MILKVEDIEIGKELAESKWYSKDTHVHVSWYNTDNDALLHADNAGGYPDFLDWQNVVSCTIRVARDVILLFV